MTARTNQELDRQDYDNPEVQNSPRRNYGQAVLRKERKGKSTKDSMAKEVTLVNSDKDRSEVYISSIGNKT